MNFLNSYISTFNFKLKSNKYLKYLFSIFGMLILISFILNRLNLNITDNDVIKNYQLNKISNSNFKNIETIIVGDSSGGNAINNKLFTKLSNSNTENLCLTGSWGIIGSLGMIQNALLENKNIKNVLIIQTLEIWNREYSKESLLELYDVKIAISSIEKRLLVSYLFNPKELLWHIKYLKNKLKNKPFVKIDNNNDYLLQKMKKYSNNKLTIDASYTLNNIEISDAKTKELNMIDSFCKKNSLNCIFLNGPMNQSVINNSKSFINYLQKDIKSKFNYIKFKENIFSYNNNKIGDSVDHINPIHKNSSTLDYYNVIKKDLIY